MKNRTKPSDFEILYSEIQIEKITRNLFKATTTVNFARRAGIVEMTGKTADIAKLKLELFLRNQPYKHLD